jgi:magnesium-transporting ATPase (P-type)
MMVTGDYHHTAIAVARGVGMVPQGGQLVIIQAKSEKQVLPRMPSRVPPALGASPAKPYQPGPTSSSCSPQRTASPSLVSFSEQAKLSLEGQQGPSCERQQSSSIEGQQSLSCEGQQMLSFEGQQRERRQRVYDGLTFMVDSGNDLEDWEPHHALTNIAQARYCTHASALLSLQSPHKQEAQLYVRCAIAML